MERQPLARRPYRKNAQPSKGPAGEMSKTASSSNPTTQKLPADQPPEVAEPTYSQTLNPTPATVRPEPPQMATADSAAPPPTITVATTSTPDEPSPEQIMMEFLQKFGHGAKASEFFARMAAACQQEETVPTLTPLEIPPRSSTLQETPTSQAITSHTETPQKLFETLAPVLPRAEVVECPHEKEAEEAEGVDKEGGEGGDDEENTQDDEGSEEGDKPEGSEGNGWGEEEDTVVTGEGIASEEEVEEDKKTGDEEGDERDDAKDIGKSSKPEEVVGEEIPEVVGEEIPGVVGEEIPTVVEGEIPAVVEGEIPADVTTDKIVEVVCQCGRR